MEVRPNLDIPVSFRWKSDRPVAGKGSADWLQQARDIAKGNNLLLMKGYYYRDEAASEEEGKNLGYRRVLHLIQILDIEEDRLVIEVNTKEMQSDARSNPFIAVEYQGMDISSLADVNGDTAEVCFPLKDSIALPGFLTEVLLEWADSMSSIKNSAVYVTGTADGTGIAESSDMAMERALYIKGLLMGSHPGINNFHLATGQREFPLKIRNRCALIYFE